MAQRYNVELCGGEGRDPHEFYQAEMDYLYTEQKRQACLWYMYVDICVFDRTDHVDLPEKQDRDYNLDLAAQKYKKLLTPNITPRKMTPLNGSWNMATTWTTGD